MSLPPSSSPSKKRKHVGAEETISHVSSHKKSKKDKTAKEVKKSKGKSKANPSSDHGQFQVVNASILMSIPPKFSLDLLSGAKEMLDSLVMKYVPALQGVMLCHSNARFLSQTAQLKYESPFSICTVSFDATVWSPQVGMKLIGRINLCSPDHISLLVHRTFNISIPREHIPTESWAFEYGPAENDPEFGPHAVDGMGSGAGDNANADNSNTSEVPIPIVEESMAEEQDDSEPRGSWVHKITSDRLGGKEGLLEFTVIGLTVANNMLSLKGSLQADPFSPYHVPQPAVPSTHVDPEGVDEEEVEELVNQQHPEAVAREDESELEGDPFAQLGQARDEALEEQSRKKQRIEEDEKAKVKEERKRRKKERKEREEKEKALAVVDGSPVSQAAAPVHKEDGTEKSVSKSPKKKRKKVTENA